MNEELLTRLVKALEGVNENLDVINHSLSEISVSLDSLENNLNGCISHVGNNSFLCVTGNVSTY